MFSLSLIFASQLTNAQDIVLKDLTGLYLANISYVEKQMQTKGFQFEGIDGNESTIYSNQVDTSIVSGGFWNTLGWDGVEKIIVSKASKKITYECGTTDLFYILSELLELGYKKEIYYDSKCFGEQSYKFFGPKNFIFLRPIDNNKFQVIIE